MGVVNVRLEGLQKSLDVSGKREADAFSFDRILSLSLSPNCGRRKKSVFRKLVMGYIITVGGRRIYLFSRRKMDR